MGDETNPNSDKTSASSVTTVVNNAPTTNGANPGNGTNADNANSVNGNADVGNGAASGDGGGDGVENNGDNSVPADRDLKTENGETDKNAEKTGDDKAEDDKKGEGDDKASVDDNAEGGDNKKMVDDEEDNNGEDAGDGAKTEDEAEATAEADAPADATVETDVPTEGDGLEEAGADAEGGDGEDAGGPTTDTGVPSEIGLSSIAGVCPPSPLTGCYLLIVLAEPHSDEHKDIILQRLIKGLLSWDLTEVHVDLEEELHSITQHAPEGEEARHGERLIQYASENLVTEVLIHPQYNTLIQCMRNLLSSFTRHRHIIHSGYTFSGNGSWILQDGTFSMADFSEAFQEHEVQRVLRAYPDTVSTYIHCTDAGLWSALPNKSYAKICKIRINPIDVLDSGSEKINEFIDYLAPMLIPAALNDLMETSDVVGNIRFSHPTLYVFPGGQGDAALFGINGFNMLVDGGFNRKACFWDFVRHLDRLDAVLMTRINNSNIGGMSSILERKQEMNVYPQIGHFFCNVPETKNLPSPDGDKDKDPLLIELIESGHHMVNNLKCLNLKPQYCYRDTEPINLYHKVGHGTLDMYVISPSKDSKEVKDFLQKWHSGDCRLFQAKDSKEFNFPLQNLVSICAMLVWLPANPEDTITRILFPGSTPDYKIIEGLDRIKHLDFMKHPTCTAKSIATPSSKKIIKAAPLEKSIAEPAFPSKGIKSLIEKPDNKTIEDKIKDQIDNKFKDSDHEIISTKIEELIIKEETVKNGHDKIIDDYNKENENEFEEQTDNKESAEQKVEVLIIKTDDIKKKEETDIKILKSKIKEKPRAEVKPVVRAKIDTKPPKSMERKVIKKDLDKKSSSPTSTPQKKDVKAKEVKAKVVSRISKSSPISTPAKSAKDANNRKVLESKQQQKIVSKVTKREASKTIVTTSSERKESKTERKVISSRRPRGVSPSKRAPGSPIKSMKPKSDFKKSKVERGGATTTDSSLVSTPSADESKKINEVDHEIDPIRQRELDDLKEEQEVVREIEAVFSRDEKKRLKEHKQDHREIAKQDSAAEGEEEEEYLIIEKEEVEQYTEDSINEQESSITKEEEIQKHQRDSQESEKKRKTSAEEELDAVLAKPEKSVAEAECIEKIDEEEKELEQNQPEQSRTVNLSTQKVVITDEVQEIISSAKEIVRAKTEEVIKTEEISSLTPEDKNSSAKKTSDTKDELLDAPDAIKEINLQESLPEEKFSGTIESGATTAPTLPEDERIPLDEIKEDLVIEEKYVKEDTKEIDVPVSPLKPPAPELERILPNKMQFASQSNLLRDIVKTPDEVADLPVHEEAEIAYDEDTVEKKTKDSFKKITPSKEDIAKEEKEVADIDIGDDIKISIIESEEKISGKVESKELSKEFLNETNEEQTLKNLKRTSTYKTTKEEHFEMSNEVEAIMEAEIVVGDINAPASATEKKIDIPEKRSPILDIKKHGEDATLAKETSQESKELSRSPSRTSEGEKPVERRESISSQILEKLPSRPPSQASEADKPKDRKPSMSSQVLDFPSPKELIISSNAKDVVIGKISRAESLVTKSDKDEQKNIEPKDEHRPSSRTSEVEKPEDGKESITTTSEKVDITDKVSFRKESLVTQIEINEEKSVEPKEESRPPSQTSEGEKPEEKKESIESQELDKSSFRKEPIISAADKDDVAKQFPSRKESLVSEIEKDEQKPSKSKEESRPSSQTSEKGKLEEIRHSKDQLPEKSPSRKESIIPEADKYDVPEESLSGKYSLITVGHDESVKSKEESRPPSQISEGEKPKERKESVGSQDLDKSPSRKESIISTAGKDDVPEETLLRKDSLITKIGEDESIKSKEESRPPSQISEGEKPKERKESVGSQGLDKSPSRKESIISTAAKDDVADETLLRKDSLITKIGKDESIKSKEESRPPSQIGEVEKPEERKESVGSQGLDKSPSRKESITSTAGKDDVAEETLLRKDSLITKIGKDESIKSKEESRPPSQVSEGEKPEERKEFVGSPVLDKSASRKVSIISAADKDDVAKPFPSRKESLVSEIEKDEQKPSKSKEESRPSSQTSEKAEERKESTGSQMLDKSPSRKESIIPGADKDDVPEESLSRKDSLITVGQDESVKSKEESRPPSQISEGEKPKERKESVGSQGLDKSPSRKESTTSTADKDDVAEGTLLRKDSLITKIGKDESIKSKEESRPPSQISEGEKPKERKESVGSQGLDKSPSRKESIISTAAKDDVADETLLRKDSLITKIGKDESIKSKEESRPPSQIGEVEKPEERKESVGSQGLDKSPSRKESITSTAGKDYVAEETLLRKDSLITKIGKDESIKSKEESRPPSQISEGEKPEERKEFVGSPVLDKSASRKVSIISAADKDDVAKPLPSSKQSLVSEIEKDEQKPSKSKEESRPSSQTSEKEKPEEKKESTGSQVLDKSPSRKESIISEADTDDVPEESLSRKDSLITVGQDESVKSKEESRPPSQISEGEKPKERKESIGSQGLDKSPSRKESTTSTAGKDDVADETLLRKDSLITKIGKDESIKSKEESRPPSQIGEVEKPEEKKESVGSQGLDKSPSRKESITSTAGKDDVAEETLLRKDSLITKIGKDESIKSKEESTPSSQIGDVEKPEEMKESEEIQDKSDSRKESIISATDKDDETKQFPSRKESLVSEIEKDEHRPSKQKEESRPSSQTSENERPEENKDSTASQALEQSSSRKQSIISSADKDDIAGKTHSHTEDELESVKSKEESRPPSQISIGEKPEERTGSVGSRVIDKSPSRKESIISSADQDDVAKQFPSRKESLVSETEKEEQKRLESKKVSRPSSQTSEEEQPEKRKDSTGRQTLEKTPSRKESIISAGDKDDVTVKISSRKDSLITVGQDESVKSTEESRPPSQISEGEKPKERKESIGSQGLDKSPSRKESIISTAGKDDVAEETLLRKDSLITGKDESVKEESKPPSQISEGEKPKERKESIGSQVLDKSPARKESIISTSDKEDVANQIPSRKESFVTETEKDEQKPSEQNEELRAEERKDSLANQAIEISPSRKESTSAADSDDTATKTFSRKESLISKIEKDDTVKSKEQSRPSSQISDERKQSLESLVLDKLSSRKESTISAADNDIADDIAENTSSRKESLAIKIDDDEPESVKSKEESRPPSQISEGEKPEERKESIGSQVKDKSPSRKESIISTADNDDVSKLSPSRKKSIVSKTEDEQKPPESKEVSRPSSQTSEKEHPEKRKDSTESQTLEKASSRKDSILSADDKDYVTVKIPSRRDSLISKIEKEETVKSREESRPPSQTTEEKKPQERKESNGSQVVDKSPSRKESIISAAEVDVEKQSPSRKQSLVSEIEKDGQKPSESRETSRPSSQASEKEKTKERSDSSASQAQEKAPSRKESIISADDKDDVAVKIPSSRDSLISKIEKEETVKSREESRPPSQTTEEKKPQERKESTGSQVVDKSPSRKESIISAAEVDVEKQSPSRKQSLVPEIEKDQQKPSESRETSRPSSQASEKEKTKERSDSSASQAQEKAPSRKESIISADDKDDVAVKIPSRRDSLISKIEKEETVKSREESRPPSQTTEEKKPQERKESTGSQVVDKSPSRKESIISAAEVDVKKQSPSRKQSLVSEIEKDGQKPSESEEASRPSSQANEKEKTEERSDSSVSQAQEKAPSRKESIISADDKDDGTVKISSRRDSLISKIERDETVKLSEESRPPSQTTEEEKREERKESTGSQVLDKSPSRKESIISAAEVDAEKQSPSRKQSLVSEIEKDQQKSSESREASRPSSQASEKEKPKERSDSSASQALEKAPSRKESIISADDKDDVAVKIPSRRDSLISKIEKEETVKSREESRPPSQTTEEERPQERKESTGSVLDKSPSRKESVMSTADKEDDATQIPSPKESFVSETEGEQKPAESKEVSRPSSETSEKKHQEKRKYSTESQTLEKASSRKESITSTDERDDVANKVPSRKDSLITKIQKDEFVKSKEESRSSSQISESEDKSIGNEVLDKSNSRKESIISSAEVDVQNQSPSRKQSLVSGIEKVGKKSSESREASRPPSQAIEKEKSKERTDSSASEELEDSPSLKESVISSAVKDDDANESSFQKDSLIIKIEKDECAKSEEESRPASQKSEGKSPEERKQSIGSQVLDKSPSRKESIISKENSRPPSQISEEEKPEDRNKSTDQVLDEAPSRKESIISAAYKDEQKSPESREESRPSSQASEKEKTKEKRDSSTSEALENSLSRKDSIISAADKDDVANETPPRKDSEITKVGYDESIKSKEESRPPSQISEGESPEEKKQSIGSLVLDKSPSRKESITSAADEDDLAGKIPSRKKSLTTKIEADEPPSQMSEGEKPKDRKKDTDEVLDEAPSRKESISSAAVKDQQKTSETREGSRPSSQASEKEKPNNKQEETPSNLESKEESRPPSQISEREKPEERKRSTESEILDKSPSRKESIMSDDIAKKIPSPKESFVSEIEKDEQKSSETKEESRPSSQASEKEKPNNKQEETPSNLESKEESRPPSQISEREKPEERKRSTESEILDKSPSRKESIMSDDIAKKIPSPKESFVSEIEKDEQKSSETKEESRPSSQVSEKEKPNNKQEETPSNLESKEKSRPPSQISEREKPEERKGSTESEILDKSPSRKESIMSTDDVAKKIPSRKESFVSEIEKDDQKSASKESSRPPSQASETENLKEKTGSAAVQELEKLPSRKDSIIAEADKDDVAEKTPSRKDSLFTEIEKDKSVKSKEESRPPSQISEAENPEERKESIESQLLDKSPFGNESRISTGEKNVITEHISSLKESVVSVVEKTEQKFSELKEEFKLSSQTSEKEKSEEIKHSTASPELEKSSSRKELIISESAKDAEKITSPKDSLITKIGNDESEIEKNEPKTSEPKEESKPSQTNQNEMADERRNSTANQVLEKSPQKQSIMSEADKASKESSASLVSPLVLSLEESRRESRESHKIESIDKIQSEAILKLVETSKTLESLSSDQKEKSRTSTQATKDEKTDHKVKLTVSSEADSEKSEERKESISSTPTVEVLTSRDIPNLPQITEKTGIIEEKLSGKREEISTTKKIISEDHMSKQTISETITISSKEISKQNIVPKEINEKKETVTERSVTIKDSQKSEQSIEVEKAIVSPIKTVAETSKDEETSDLKSGFEISSFTTELRETHITTVCSPQVESKSDLISDDYQIQVYEREDSGLNDIKEEDEEDRSSPPQKGISKPRLGSLETTIQQIRPSSPREEEVLKIVANVAEVLKSDKPITEIIPDFDEKELEEKISKTAKEIDGSTVQRMLVTASSEDGGEEIEICPEGTIKFTPASTPDILSGKTTPDVTKEVFKEIEKHDRVILETEIARSFKIEQETESKKSSPDDDSKATIKSLPGSEKSSPELKSTSFSIEEKDKLELLEKDQVKQETSETAEKNLKTELESEEVFSEEHSIDAKIETTKVKSVITISTTSKEIETSNEQSVISPITVSTPKIEKKDGDEMANKSSIVHVKSSKESKTELKKLDLNDISTSGKQSTENTTKVRKFEEIEDQKDLVSSTTTDFKKQTITSSHTHETNENITEVSSELQQTISSERRAIKTLDDAASRKESIISNISRRESQVSDRASSQPGSDHEDDNEDNVLLIKEGRSKSIASIMMTSIYKPSEEVEMFATLEEESESAIQKTESEKYLLEGTHVSTILKPETETIVTTYLETAHHSSESKEGRKTPPTVPVSPNIKAEFTLDYSKQTSSGTREINESGTSTPKDLSGKSSPGVLTSESRSLPTPADHSSAESSPKPTSPFPRISREDLKESPNASTADLTHTSTPDVTDVTEIKNLDKSSLLSTEKVITTTVTTITKVISADGKEIVTEEKIITTTDSSAPDTEKVTVTKTRTTSESDKKDIIPSTKEVAALKSEFRVSTPGGDDFDPHEVQSPRSDISSGQASRLTEDDEIPPSPLSATSQAAQSPPSKFSYELQHSSSGVSKKSDLDIDDSHDEIPPQYGSEELKCARPVTISHKTDPMSTSFYGALPETFSTKSDPIPITTTTTRTYQQHSSDSFEKTHVWTDKKPDHKFLDEADLDFEKALEEHKQVRGEEVMTCVTSKYSYSPSKAVEIPSSPKKQFPLEDPLQKSKDQTPKEDDSTTGKDISDETKDDKKDPSKIWGKPLGLPSPAPLNESQTTPKRERKLLVSRTKFNNEKNLRKRSESPIKNGKKNQPIYMDLTYVPHSGNSYYSHLEFFKKVRARYYVFSGTEPSREVYNALLEAKQTWEDKDLEVTIIPTYDTDVLGYWVSENEELLAKYHIDLSPSAARCTINLQDHETSCSAYRLEF